MEIKKASIFTTEILKKISNIYPRYMKDIFRPSKNTMTEMK